MLWYCNIIKDVKFEHNLLMDECKNVKQKQFLKNIKERKEFSFVTRIFIIILEKVMDCKSKNYIILT